MSALEGHVFHNRLTHTIKVAQVARRLAELLIRAAHEKRAKDSTLPELPLNADAAEAAAHAHDIGHPPFGHVAEVELQRIMTDVCGNDTFEGNAQSFRIVTKVASSHPKHRGLDLTRATLNGILKYPWLQNGDGSPRNKWGAYTSEREDFEFARESTPDSQVQSLEAAVMDWADDITYAVHDVEDLYRAGLIPADRLRASPSTREEFAEWVYSRWLADDRPESEAEILRSLKVFDLLGTTAPYEGSTDQRVALRMFTSSLIKRYVPATEVVYDGTAWKLQRPPGAMEVNVLKELTWRYVIERPALASQQHGQKKVVRDLFAILSDAADSGKKEVDAALLPLRVREDLKSLEKAGMSTPSNRARLICDAICSITEDEALRLHYRLTGQSLGSVLDAIV